MDVNRSKKILDSTFRHLEEAIKEKRKMENQKDRKLSAAGTKNKKTTKK